MRTLASALSVAVIAAAAALAPGKPDLPAAEPPVRVGSATPDQAELDGTWTIAREEGRLHLNVHYARSSNWGRSIDREELRGLTDAQIDAPSSTPVAFRIEREAGGFEMEGAFREGRGAGHFEFRPNPAFAGTLRSLGVRDAGEITERQLMHLALADASSARVRELIGLLGAFDAEDLIKLSIHGVTPEYVRSLREAGISGTGTVDAVVEMRIHNIDVEYIRELESLGFRELSRQRLLEMGIHGVSAEQVRELQALGYRDLSPQQLVNLRIHGVTPEYIRYMREGGFTDLTPDGLVELKIHRVTPEYVRELAELGYRDLSREMLLQMGIHGVTPAFIREMRQAGFDDLEPEALVRLKIHGIDSEFVRGARNGRG